MHCEDGGFRGKRTLLTSRGTVQLTRYHCSGTLMIYWGSGSDFEKISAPIPAPVPVPNPETDPRPYLAQLFNKIIGKKSCLSSLTVRNRIVSQKVGLSFLIIL